MVYFTECDEIVFRKETGEKIWSTKDEEGQMDVPAGIGVFIYWGMCKE